MLVGKEWIYLFNLTLTNETMSSGEHEHNWKTAETRVIRDGETGSVRGIEVYTYCEGCMKYHAIFISDHCNLNR